jgi:hypothetical protein
MFGSCFNWTIPFRLIMLFVYPVTKLITVTKGALSSVKHVPKNMKILSKGTFVQLTSEQAQAQNYPMKYRTAAVSKIEFELNGMTETFTVPVNIVCNGNNMTEQLFNQSVGMSWIIHDMLYSLKRCDVRNGNSTKVDRFLADEILCQVLDLEDQRLYATTIRAWKELFTTQLAQSFIIDASFEDLTFIDVYPKQ